MLSFSCRGVVWHGQCKLGSVAHYGLCWGLLHICWAEGQQFLLMVSHWCSGTKSKCTNSSHAYTCVTSLTFHWPKSVTWLSNIFLFNGKWIIFLISNKKYKNLSGLFVLFTVPSYTLAHSSLPEILWRRQNFFLKISLSVERRAQIGYVRFYQLDGFCQSCDYKESPFHCSSNALPVAGISPDIVNLC